MCLLCGLDCSFLHQTLLPLTFLSCPFFFPTLTSASLKWRASKRDCDCDTLQMRLWLAVIVCRWWLVPGPLSLLPHVHLIYSLTCANIWSVITCGFPLTLIGRSPKGKKKKRGVAIDHSGQADKYWPAKISQSSRRLEPGPARPSSGKQWKRS